MPCELRTHHDTIKDRPQASPDAKRGAAHDGEANVVHGTDATGEDDEDGRQAIAQPHGQPRLPPGQPADNHGRGNHPGGNVEGVGDPEADKVPAGPLALALRDGLQVRAGELASTASLASAQKSRGHRRFNGAY